MYKYFTSNKFSLLTLFCIYIIKELKELTVFASLIGSVDMPPIFMGVGV